MVTLAQVLNLFYFFIETERTLLTSEDHGFGRFESWESFDWLLLQVECVTDLGLFHILHPCYDVTHLTCKSTKKPTSESNTNLQPSVFILQKPLHTCK